MKELNCQVDQSRPAKMSPQKLKGCKVNETSETSETSGDEHIGRKIKNRKKLCGSEKVQQSKKRYRSKKTVVSSSGESELSDKENRLPSEKTSTKRITVKSSGLKHKQLFSKRPSSSEEERRVSERSSKDKKSCKPKMQSSSEDVLKDNQSPPRTKKIKKKSKHVVWSSDEKKSRKHNRRTETESSSEDERKMKRSTRLKYDELRSLKACWRQPLKFKGQIGGTS